jgi:branched-subunit amino acid transport protein AzlD
MPSNIFREFESKRKQNIVKKKEKLLIFTVLSILSIYN